MTGDFQNYPIERVAWSIGLYSSYAYVHYQEAKSAAVFVEGSQPGELFVAGLLLFNSCFEAVPKGCFFVDCVLGSRWRVAQIVASLAASGAVIATFFHLVVLCMRAAQRCWVLFAEMSILLVCGEWLRFVVYK